MLPIDPAARRGSLRPDRCRSRRAPTIERQECHLDPLAALAFYGQPRRKTGHLKQSLPMGAAGSAGVAWSDFFQVPIELRRPPQVARFERTSGANPLSHVDNQLNCLVQVERPEIKLSENCPQPGVQLASQGSHPLLSDIDRQIAWHGKLSSD